MSSEGDAFLEECKIWLKEKKELERRLVESNNALEYYYTNRKRGADAEEHGKMKQRVYEMEQQIKLAKQRKENWNKKTPVAPDGTPCPDGKQSSRLLKDKYRQDAAAERVVIQVVSDKKRAKEQMKVFMEQQNARNMEPYLVKQWNLYGSPNSESKSSKDLRKDLLKDTRRRDFCGGCSADDLATQFSQDVNTEFETPGAYQLAQRLRDPNPETGLSNAHEYVRERKVPVPYLNGAGPYAPNTTMESKGEWKHRSKLVAESNEAHPGIYPGITDRSLGWASVASWYYPRHEEIIEECWDMYEQFKDKHGQRTTSETSGPFVNTTEYKNLQEKIDTLDFILAPTYYASVRDGLDVAQLFLGNGKSGAAFQRFTAASRAGELPNEAPPISKSKTEDCPYLPLKSFIEFVFATAPATGGPNWDNGINPRGNARTQTLREGVKNTTYKHFTELSKEDYNSENKFTAWVNRRKLELNLDLRIMAGLFIPTTLYEVEDSNRTWRGATILIRKLWAFLLNHAWPVYKRAVANPPLNFASIVPYFPGWFRDVHYDEYDRWAYMKWKNDTTNKNNERDKAAKKMASQSPDIYTLMKRRHKLEMQADECKEAFRPETTPPGDYEATYEQERQGAPAFDIVISNVRKPRSGGRTYGAGAYRAPMYDPYCAFGRQRDYTNMPIGKLTDMEEPFTDWQRLKALTLTKECSLCNSRDEFDKMPTPSPIAPPPPPPRPKRKPNDTRSAKDKKRARLTVPGFSGKAGFVSQSRRIVTLAHLEGAFREQMTLALTGHLRAPSEAV